MGVMPILQRSLRAVQTLGVGPSDRLLEIGCGRGVAVSLVCERLVDGRITAIDRSAAMIRLAEQRNRRHVATGRAVLRAVALEDFEPGPERFDTVFASNVSLFWLTPAAKELEIVRRVLAPGGALYLFYEQPGAARTGEIAEKLLAVLGAHGLAASAVTTSARRSAQLLSVVARARVPAHSSARR